MARFVLRDGEREQARTLATDTRKHVAGALVLTEQRAVLLATENTAGGLLAVLFGALGFAAAALTATETVTTQILRTELAGVELTGPGTIKLWSRGEGYGRIWFEVKLDRADAWRDTIQHWAEHGVVPGDFARLPVAKVVKRG